MVHRFLHTLIQDSQRIRKQGEVSPVQSIREYLHSHIHITVMLSLGNESIIQPDASDIFASEYRVIQHPSSVYIYTLHYNKAISTSNFCLTIKTESYVTSNTMLRIPFVHNLITQVSVVCLCMACFDVSLSVNNILQILRLVGGGQLQLCKVLLAETA